MTEFKLICTEVHRDDALNSRDELRDGYSRCISCDKFFSSDEVCDDDCIDCVVKFHIENPEEFESYIFQGLHRLRGQWERAYIETQRYLGPAAPPLDDGRGRHTKGARDFGLIPKPLENGFEFWRHARYSLPE